MHISWIYTKWKFIFISLQLGSLKGALMIFFQTIKRNSSICLFYPWLTTNSKFLSCLSTSIEWHKAVNQFSYSAGRTTKIKATAKRLFSVGYLAHILNYLHRTAASPEAVHFLWLGREHVGFDVLVSVTKQWMSTIWIYNALKR